MLIPLAIKAAHFAEFFHANQTRDDNITPYIAHPLRVGTIVAQYFTSSDVYSNSLDTLIAAAYLHDTIEDTSLTLDRLNEEFGWRVATLVSGLTNVFTKEAYPNHSRRQRKEMEVARLKETSISVRFIKLADRLDNLYDLDINLDDIGWIKVFVRESQELVDAIGNANRSLAELIQCRITDLEQQVLSKLAGTMKATMT